MSYLFFIFYFFYKYQDLYVEDITITKYVFTVHEPTEYST